ncbi:hypothetical protein NM208_g560 [Fusarium decemcellulare]|uniref:Uncharacterized protein n=2 Tax=Fusarium decemcellulare TaxID=57161 RepID=A0ACC1SYK3_9HYPO|nr:hypothetical protein NM208_g753 [Fusarium decemcellulare]KAJ3549315.1 hypothetical protein NM208_g560 [Fusarium decemcellulare]
MLWVLLAVIPLTQAICSWSHQPASDDLCLATAPQSLRPYVLPKGAGQGVALGQQVIRFPVTSNSSGGAFSLLLANAPSSDQLGVLPHTHQIHYENFYCTKGRVQLWAQKNESNAAEQEGRLLYAGDYGAVPLNTKHVFQTLDPDTQVAYVIFPGGFERLFLAVADSSYDSITGAEYAPVPSSPGGQTNDPEVIAMLQSFDSWAALDFQPRRDLVNGSAGSNKYNWHDGPNPLIEDPEGFSFIAKGYGPKYLNTESGYKVIAPLLSAAQSGGNGTMGTITMSPRLPNETISTVTLPGHVSFFLEEGHLLLEVEGYQTAYLIQGDVAFIPSGTTFSYYATAAHTKFMYVSEGEEGIDIILLKNSIPWDYPVYPAYAGYAAE